MITTSPLDSGLLNNNLQATENSIPNTLTTNSNQTTNSNPTSTRTKKRTSKQGEFE